MKFILKINTIKNKFPGSHHEPPANTIKLKMFLTENTKDTKKT